MKIPSVVRCGIASCAAALVVSSLAWSTGSVAATPSPLPSPPRLGLQPLNGLPAVPTDVAHHRQELVAFKTGVLDMDPAAVASSTQVVGGGEVVVRRPAVDFHVGQVVTAPVTPTLTSGVAGRVTKVTSVGGSTRLVLAPVRPDEVYSSYRISRHIDLKVDAAAAVVVPLQSNAPVAAATPRQPSLKLTKVQFACSGSNAPVLDIDLSDTQFDIDVDLYALRATFSVVAHPVVKLGLNSNNSLACSASGLVKLRIPLPGDFWLDVVPKLEISVGGGINFAAVWDPTIAVSFAAGGGPVPLAPSFKNHGSFTMSAENSVDAFLGLDAQVSFNNNVGIGGSIGGALSGSWGTAKPQCVDLTAMVRAELTASVDLWIKDWSFVLAHGDFFKTPLADWCPGSPIAVGDTAPILATVPVVTGSPVFGEALTATAASFRGDQPMNLAVRWQRCNASGQPCVDIAGASGQTYALDLADVGARVRAVVTATNSLGSLDAASAPTSIITAPPPSVTVGSTVAGTLTLGSYLSVDSSGSTVGTLTVSHQWQRCSADGLTCTSIPGATGVRYRLTEADIGFRLRDVITVTGLGGATSKPSGMSGVFVDPGMGYTEISIFGVPRVTNSMHVLSWSENTPAGVSVASETYQWLRCDTGGANCAAASGVMASAASYVIVPADLGYTLRFKITATTNTGVVFTGQSSPSGVVQTAPATPGFEPGFTTTPELIALGFAPTETVAINHLGYAYAGTPTVTYQWKRCLPGEGAPPWCPDIPGATGSQYQLTSADVGSTVTVRVDVTTEYGTNYTMVPATPVVQAIVPSPYAPPEILGSPAAVGYSLVASPPGYFGPAPTAYSYQWNRCLPNNTSCSPLSNGGSQVYVPTASDVGWAFSATITASTSDGSAVPVTTPVSPTITGIPPTATTPPILFGLPALGQTVWATAYYSGSPDIVSSYSWERCDPSNNCQTIPGATASTYSPTVADVGDYLRVHMSGANAYGSTPDAVGYSAPVQDLGTGPDLLTSGSVDIGDGSPTVAAAATTLAITPPSTATEMMVSSDSSFTGADWQPIITTMPWTLSGPTDGTPSSAYVRFRGGGVNTYPVASAASAVDTVPPQVASLLVQTNAVSNTANLRVDATDLSGVTGVQIASSQSVPGPWHPFGVQISANPAGATQHFVRLQDGVGNVGPWTAVMMGDPIWSSAALTNSPPAISTSGSFDFSFISSAVGNDTVSFTCYVDSLPAQVCQSPYSVSGLADGLHTFRVVPTDSTGTVGAEATATWRVDTSAGPPPVGSPPPEFASLSPVRVFDTRPDQPQGAVSVVKQKYGGAGNILRVKVAGAAGVPTSGVGAVSLNVTVVSPDGPGFVTVFPCGDLPLASNLNYLADQVVPNAVLVPVSASGEVCFYSLVDTHLIADINGWFATGST